MDPNSVWEGTANPLVVIPQSYFPRYGWIHKASASHYEPILLYRKNLLGTFILYIFDDHKPNLLEFSALGRPQTHWARCFQPAA